MKYKFDPFIARPLYISFLFVCVPCFKQHMFLVDLLFRMPNESEWWLCALDGNLITFGNL